MEAVGLGDEDEDLASDIAPEVEIGVFERSTCMRKFFIA